MIKAENLTRRFGSITAVDGVSFSVKNGEVLGFLGPNGAGKTTTMRMITGYLEPSEGKILVDGIDVVDNPVKTKQLIGYLPENAPVYRDMSVIAFLKFVAEIRGLRGKKAIEAIDRAIAISHLEPVTHQNIDTLSKGYVRRTSFAQSIIHDPPILILDEPTDGLDPNQKHEVRQMIHEMGRNKAIIISTHILEEVEACCSRALIIAGGKVVADGTPQELKQRSATANTLILSAEGMKADAMLAKIAPVKGVKDVEIISEQAVRAYPDSNTSAGKLAGKILTFCSEENIVLKEISTDSGRLDDVFRTITGNKQSGEKIS